MASRPLPPDDRLTIGFAHASFHFQDRFRLRNTGLRSFQVRSLDDLQARIGEIDVLVASFLWRNEMAARAPRLAYIQSISAGTDQFSREVLRGAGIRLASAQGANERAVAQHAMAFVLAIARQIPGAVRDQARHRWRGPQPTIAQREDELGGKTLVIVGMGRIGSRVARHAKAFDMTVIGVKRDPAQGAAEADRVVATSALLDVLPEADYVVLTCPLTPQTQGLIDARAFAAMKPTAALVNVARGRVVDEPALIDALNRGVIAAAAVDCTADEPLAADAALWETPGMLITSHVAGESRRYEDNVIDLLLENLGRLRRAEAELKNGIV